MAKDPEDITYDDLQKSVETVEEEKLEFENEQIGRTEETPDIAPEKDTGLSYYEDPTNTTPTSKKSISFSDPNDNIPQGKIDELINDTVLQNPDMLEHAITTDVKRINTDYNEINANPAADATDIVVEAGMNGDWVDRTNTNENMFDSYLGVGALGEGVESIFTDLPEVGWNASTDVVEEAMVFASNALFGRNMITDATIGPHDAMDQMGMDTDETGKNIEEGIRGFFDSIQASTEEDLPPKEERLSALKDAIDKYRPGHTEEQRNRFARSLNNEVEKGRKSAVAYDKVGTEVVEQGLKLVLPIISEIKTFSATMNASRMIPGAYSTLGRTSRTAGAAITSGGAAGASYEFIDQSFETIEPEEDLGPNEKKAIEYDKIVKSAWQDSLFNLAIGTSAVGAATGYKVFGKGLNTGVGYITNVKNNLEDVLSSTVPADKVRQIKDISDEIETLVGKGNRSDAVAKGKELKELLLDDDLLNEASKIDNRLRKSFKGMFGLDGDDVDDKTADRAMSRLLEFRYAKDDIDKLDPEEKLDFDTYLWRLGDKPEQKEEAVDLLATSMDLDKMSADELEEAIGKLTKEADFFNPSIIRNIDDPSKLKEESPVMHKLFADGDAKPEDMFIDKEDLKGDYKSWAESFKDSTWGKWIGPQWLMAGKTAKTSDVPIDIAQMEASSSIKRTQTAYQQGYDGLAGGSKIDDFFRNNDMEIELHDEKHKQVTELLRRVEYDTTKLDDEFLENNLHSEDQVKTAKFVRDWFKKAAEVFDLEPKRMIDNYLPRLPDMSGTTQARKALQGDAPVYNRFKKAREEHEAVDGAELSKDLQDMMKRYLHAGAYEKHAKPAMMNFESQVNKLRSLNHPDAKHWSDWLKEMRGQVQKKTERGEQFMNGLADKVKTWDQATGYNLQRWFKNHRPGDILSAAVYGNYLFARQDFRLMNAGQSIQTAADAPIESFEWANKKSFNNAEKLDSIISKSGVRNDADQFGEMVSFARSNEGKSSSGILGYLKKAKNKLFSYDNITASDAFNVRRSFASGAHKAHRGLKKYKNGNISWDQYIRESQMDMIPEPTLNKVKDFIDEGKIGMMKDPSSGERYTLEEALELGSEDVKQLEMDLRSAEGVAAFNTTFATQWEYGKGALGKMYWKGNTDLKQNIAQNAILPFTTWSVNYIHRLKKLADNPAKNADRLMKQGIFAAMYAEQIEKFFDVNAASFFGGGPIPDQLLFSPGISTIMSGYTAAAAGGKLPTADDESGQFWRNRMERNADKFFSNLIGEGTNARRFATGIRDISGGAIANSIELVSSGAYSSTGRGPVEFVEDVILGGVKINNVTKDDAMKKYRNLISDNPNLKSDPRGDVRATGRGR